MKFTDYIKKPTPVQLDESKQPVFIKKGDKIQMGDIVGTGNTNAQAVIKDVYASMMLGDPEPMLKLDMYWTDKDGNKQSQKNMSMSTSEFLNKFFK